MEKRQTQIRLPASLFEEIKKRARESNRSMNGQLVELIQLGLKIDRKEAKTESN